MQREATELAIPDHHLKICWMLTSRPPGRLVEFDAIHTHRKGEPLGTRLCSHNSPPCSVRFKKVGAESVSEEGENPTAGFRSATVIVPLCKELIAWFNSRPDTSPPFS